MVGIAMGTAKHKVTIRFNHRAKALLKLNVTKLVSHLGHIQISTPVDKLREKNKPSRLSFKCPQWLPNPEAGVTLNSFRCERWGFAIFIIFMVTHYF